MPDPTPDLTRADRALLARVNPECDVYNPETAERLTSLQARHPDLVELLKPNPALYGNNKVLPYFVAVVTDAGRALMEAA